MRSPNETSTRSVDALTGRVLDGRYELMEKAGTGGMATVYRARDRRLGRTVAVKVLHPHFSSDKEWVQRFEREAEFAAGLSAHPNIVSVYDVGCDEALHYMVMEYVDGPSLKTLIERDAPFPVAQALHIASEIAAALDFAHLHGFVHRDIKPQNVLITGDETVKVADFGIARSVHGTQMTQADTVLGTAHYLSPEQAKGRAAQPMTDVYGLGVVLFEMLTAQVPFDADTSIAVALQHIQKPPPIPSTYNQTVPAWVDALILRALAKDPRDRYLTAGKFREAMAHRPGPTKSKPLPTRAMPVVATAHWRLDMLALMILIVAGASALGAYGTYRGLSSLFASKPLTASGQSGKHDRSTSTHPRHPGSSGHNTTHRSGPSGTNTGQAAALAGDVKLSYIWVDPAAVQPGQSTTLRYTIGDTTAQPVRIGLGAMLAGSTGSTLTDPAHNQVVTLQPGTAYYRRTFVVPASAPAGSYDLIVNIDNPSMSKQYGNSIRMPNLITVGST